MFGGYAKENLLITDLRGPWSDINNHSATAKDQIQISKNEKFIDEWTIEINDKTDKDGWSYASNWPDNNWFSANKAICFVRHRKWKRTKEVVKSSQDERSKLKQRAQQN